MNKNSQNPTEQVQADTAQAQQEPVAWMYEWNGRTHITTADQRPIEHAHPHFNKSKPLYTAPQPTENLRCKSTQKRLATLWGYVKPQHLQPLTDEQMYSLYCEAMKGYYVSALHYWRNEEAHKFARAIEAAVANQPPRQPLTEEQIKAAVRHLYGSDAVAAMAVTGDIETARAVEAAHGIGSTHG